MPQQMERFETEEQAVVCAKKNNGITERQDWTLLPESEKKKPWVAKWGDGIVPPPPVNMEELMNPVPVLRAKVADLSEKVARLEAQVIKLGGKKDAGG